MITNAPLARMSLQDKRLRALQAAVRLTATKPPLRIVRRHPRNAFIHFESFQRKHSAFTRKEAPFTGQCEGIRELTPWETFIPTVRTSPSFERAVIKAVGRLLPMGSPSRGFLTTGDLARSLAVDHQGAQKITLVTAVCSGRTLTHETPRRSPKKGAM